MSSTVQSHNNMSRGYIVCSEIIHYKLANRRKNELEKRKERHSKSTDSRIRPCIRGGIKNFCNSV